MKSHWTKILGAALLAGAIAGTAFAGGPNYMFDAANKIPYVWHMDTWPNGQVPVYTDLGNLKDANPLVPNSVGVNWTIGAWDQWNNVPTSTFRAHVVGNVSLLGLGDITLANVAQVFPAFNGGGVVVVFDVDGSIFKNWLGFSNNSGILGIGFQEFYASGTNEILEGTVFINGKAIAANDPGAIGASGVYTHEFGHIVNLAHTQSNGAVFNNGVQDAPFPYGCTNQPYAGGPGQGPTGQQIETMYPFLDPRLGVGSSQYQYTVDRLDDISAISDLYPAPGWPQNYGTIKGTIYQLTKINGSGNGPTQPVTGVNIIARNLADPYNDFTSIVSGGLTRGSVPDDGTFEIHGLTPGATYGVYVDFLAAGAFPYPETLSLPGPEEWWNGANESGDGKTDNRCAWTGIPVTAGSVTTADITFNRIHEAPTWTLMDFAGNPSALTADGTTMVGTRSNLQGYWLWSTTDGYQEIGGLATPGGLPGISDDGSKVAGNVLDNGVAKWGLWDRATATWTVLPPAAGVTACNFVGGNFIGPTYGLVYGISGDGSTVVGGNYIGRSSTGGCRRLRTAQWTEAGGTVVLPKLAPDTTSNNSRATYVNYDGSVIVGYDEAPTRAGAYWINGVPNLIGGYPQDPHKIYGQPNYVTRDGVTALGGTPFSNQNSIGGAFKYNITTGQYDVLFVNPDLSENLLSAAQRSDDTANVVAGFDQNTNGQFTAKFWMPLVGWVNVKDFLNAQGVYLWGPLAANIQAMSANGQVWVGLAGTSAGNVPYRVEIPKAIVCHKNPKKPNATPESLAVEFPAGFSEHLAHGDPVGLCPFSP